VSVNTRQSLGMGALVGTRCGEGLKRPMQGRRDREHIRSRFFFLETIGQIVKNLPYALINLNTGFFAEERDGNRGAGAVKDIKKFS